MTGNINFRIAVKAFIQDEEGKLLLLKRSSNSPHKPDVWDVAGGRLDLGENPFLGLKREVSEETNLQIEIEKPIQVNHFTRDDGQTITMICFQCKTENADVVLSEEHMAYKWCKLEEAVDIICPHMLLGVKVLQKLNNNGKSNL